MNNEPDYQDNLFFDNRIPEENRKLKELLKECSDAMHQSILSVEHYRLLHKIDEVLYEEAS